MPLPRSFLLRALHPRQFLENNHRHPRFGIIVPQLIMHDLSIINVKVFWNSNGVNTPLALTGLTKTE